MKNLYTFYNDPGHGWLRVQRQELIDLGIADKITPYSYQKDDLVYLEEDCDAGKFLEAYNEFYGFYPVIDEVYQERTPIRRMAAYRPTGQTEQWIRDYASSRNLQYNSR